MQNQNRPMFAPGFDNQGTIGQEGTPFPAAAAGDHHALISTSRRRVDNRFGEGESAMWKRLVEQGFAVRPATPTRKVEVPIFQQGKYHRGQVKNTSADQQGP
jgi:hypothetical protein